jgi:hypothetical protein
MTPRVYQIKVGPENCAEHSRITSNGRQAAATLRPIQSKGAYDNVSAGSDDALQTTDIGGTVGSVGEEMKRSTVVPQIVSLGWLPGGDIGNDPFDVTSPVAKALLGCIESGG